MGDAVSQQSCPACGETDALRGRPEGDDIAITCEQCGAEWMRGEPRCRRCGRAGGTTAPQQMTRHPRGTLLAVVGVRQVTLCQVCDGDVLADALTRRLPIPEGYVSRFLFGEPSATPPVRPAAPRRRPPPRDRSSSRPTPPAPRPAAPAPAPDITDPTLRQATEAFLTDVGVATESLTMVLLGSRFGASTRLSRLDDLAVAEELTSWVVDTFAKDPRQREAAIDTLRRAVTDWRQRGWLTHDLAVHLG